MESIVKTSALCAATLLFVAPLREFEEVRRKKHVGERSVFPYVCMWANSALWIVYGLYTGDLFPTVTTNLVGLFFSMYYCVVFAWAVEPRSRKNETYNMFAGTFLLVCAVSTFCLGSFPPIPKELDNGRIKHYSGLAASTSTAVQYASPLAELLKVLKRRSTEGMSSVLAGVSLLCSSLWFYYGVISENSFIYVPNVLGIIFSITQCSLFYFFPGRTPRLTETSDKGTV